MKNGGWANLLKEQTFIERQMALRLQVKGDSCLYSLQVVKGGMVAHSVEIRDRF